MEALDAIAFERRRGAEDHALRIRGNAAQRADPVLIVLGAEVCPQEFAYVFPNRSESVDGFSFDVRHARFPSKITRPAAGAPR